jgi:hypothetical protein
MGLRGIVSCGIIRETRRDGGAGMELKTVKIIYLIIALLGLAVFAVGLFADSTIISVIGVAVIISAVIFHVIFYRCPCCGRYLGKNIGGFCQYCGEKLDN